MLLLTKNRNIAHVNSFEHCEKGEIKLDLVCMK